MLLQQLLYGKLVEYSKDTLEAETQNMPRLYNLPLYRDILTKVLDVFHNRQIYSKKTLNSTLQAYRFCKKLPRPLDTVLEVYRNPILYLLSCPPNDLRLVPLAISVRQIVDIKPSFSAPLADLTYDFFVK